jgi:hypothetical protein
VFFDRERCIAVNRSTRSIYFGVGTIGDKFMCVSDLLVGSGVLYVHSFVVRQRKKTRRTCTKSTRRKCNPGRAQFLSA